MPRGRGTRRNTRRRGNSRGGRSSTSRYSSSTVRPGSSRPRRSARLAERSSSQELLQQPVSGRSMADVARRTQTTRGPRSRAVEADLLRERSRQRSRRARVEISDQPDAARGDNLMGQKSRRDPSQQPALPDDEEIPNYAMDVLVQPPPTVRAGRSLAPIVTVRLRSLQQELEEDDAAHLLAVATLVAEHADKTHDELQNALAGRRFDSIHPFTDETESRGVGYASFPDLVIRDEGVYRIRVTLIKVRNAAGGESPIPDGGSNVHAVETNPITVEGTSDSGEFNSAANASPLRAGYDDFLEDLMYAGEE